MNTDWHDLIQRHMEGLLDDEEASSLKDGLKTDPELRRLYLDYMNLDVALEAQAESQAAVNEMLALPTRGVAKHGTGWEFRRPLAAAAAAGIVFGMFCTSVVLAYTRPKSGEVKATVRSILIESFESGAAGTFPGLPREAGVWSGDEARVVGAEKGVTPMNGRKMLRFVRATYSGENATHSSWGDVYHLVDLRGQVALGKSVLRLSAGFAGASAPDGEAYWCNGGLYALEADFSDAQQPLALTAIREISAAVASRRFALKREGRWQEVTTEVPVSPQTQFVLVHLAVDRTLTVPSVEPVQFSGHYLDEVKLELITRPPGA